MLPSPRSFCIILSPSKKSVNKTHSFTLRERMAVKIFMTCKQFTNIAEIIQSLSSPNHAE